MKKSKTQKYFAILSGLAVFFIVSWTYYIHTFMEWLNTSGAPLLRTEEVFLNLMGRSCNYINEIQIKVMYLVLLILALSFIFFTDKPSFLVRLKSRKSYINKHIFDIVLFTSLFVLLIELINVIGAFIAFDTNIVLNFKLLEYSALDFITLFLFYFRAGILLVIIGVLTNKKFAPFITFAIYFIEFFFPYYIPALNAVWLPHKDAISVIYLLTGAMQPSDTLLIIIIGIIINFGLVLLAYYLFAKKDIIKNEKK